MIIQENASQKAQTLRQDFDAARRHLTPSLVADICPGCHYYRDPPNGEAPCQWYSSDIFHYDLRQKKYWCKYRR